MNSHPGMPDHLSGHDAAPSAEDGVALSQLPHLFALQKEEYLRLAAEFENFKKRSRRDFEQKAAAGKEGFIHDLLPVVDNLERALACGPTASPAQLRQGVAMTLQLLGRLLHSHGIEPVEDLHKTFDPHSQEAVSVRADPTLPEQSVLEVVQRGYRQGGKVFRAAKVVVNERCHYPGATHAR